MTKQCCRCKDVLPVDAFNKDAATPDGLRYNCKACRAAFHTASRERENARTRAWRGAHPGHEKAYRKANMDKFRAKAARYRKAHPEQARAKGAVHQAVKTGKLIRPDACAVCHAVGKVDGHHEDYTRKLDVIWLCGACHRARHADMAGFRADLGQTCQKRMSPPVTQQRALF